MTDTHVILGGITLAGMEIPESISYGGEHLLGVHQLPGGVRVVDAMGADDADLRWSGLFFGPQADQRARFVDFLRKQGQPVTLSWGGHVYDVVIKSFDPDYERFYQVPYKIVCLVVDDLTAPVNAAAAATVDDLAGADMTNILTSAQALGMTVPSSFPGPAI